MHGEVSVITEKSTVAVDGVAATVYTEPRRAGVRKATEVRWFGEKGHGPLVEAYASLELCWL